MDHFKRKKQGKLPKDMPRNKQLVLMRRAPTSRLDMIPSLIALAMRKDWVLYQLDVKSPFLIGQLEEEY